MTAAEKMKKLAEKLLEKRKKEADAKKTAKDGYAACSTPTQKANFIAEYLGIKDSEETQ